ncbi:MAG TPA: tRNA glutamyl-Q(34) synthetase GluQRS [Tepidisphaeraceae bacterium]|jgi:glutamyl-tRNA synthetase
MATTRLAPSPTGALHLGNARTFLINWILAKQLNWRILLRIEDLDGPRVKAAADRLLIDDLNYLGLDWDEGPVYQSSRAGEYRAAIESLIARGLAYPCVCSRKEVDSAASAPHAEDGASIYPGTCRGKFSSAQEAKEKSGREPAIRFLAADRDVEFDDRFLGRFAGRQSLNVSRRLGDFVIAKADGTAAYQLAVVVDDLAGSVTEVVRGDDLLKSTFRQILLYEALGATGSIPRYTHLPLVVGTDGRRLAKRHGDTRIATYREMGVGRSRMLGLLAKWCGMNVDGPIDDPRRLVAEFDLAAMSRSPIVFTADDDAWLRGTSE